jgi:hypothetical protein
LEITRVSFPYVKRGDCYFGRDTPMDVAKTLRMSGKPDTTGSVRRRRVDS